MKRFVFLTLAITLAGCGLTRYEPETAASAEDRLILTRAPLQSSSTANEGFAALRSGNLALAEPLFRQAISEAPTDAYAHLGMGATMEQTGRTFEAARHYRSAERYGGSVRVMRTVALDGRTASTDGTTISVLARENLARLEGR